MSHEIESTDSVLHAIGTETPWHGLSKEVDPNVPLCDVAREYNLDWEVFTEQMYRVNRGSDRPQFLPVDKQVALVRSDTDFVLGTATSDYRVFQNTEGFAALQGLIDSGAVRMDVVGSLKGGKIVWGMLSTDKDTLEVGDGDSIKRYILFSWGHDGKTGLSFGTTDIRVVCWNTIMAAWNSELSQLIRVSHRGTVHANVDMVIKALDTSDLQFKATVEDYRKMLSTNISKEDIRSYVKQVLDLEESTKNKRATNLIDKVSTLASMGIGNDGIGSTVWGAFNAVTEYLSHQAARNVDNRLASLWWGQNAGVLKRAHEHAMKLAA